MNNIKDISSGHAGTKKSLSILGELDDKNIFFINRAKKIVTAIYMVTNLMDKDDGLSALIRQKSLELIQHLFDNLKDTNYKSLKKAQYSLYETLSYIEIVFSTENMTAMNYNILLGEIHSFQKDIDTNLNSFNGKKDLRLSDLFFSKKEDSNNTIKEIDNKKNFKQETFRLEKKTDIVKSVKSKRHDNILDILKQKKNASIKEICSLFKDCSSKTIQRDLKELIGGKKVVKRGDRRWATYNLKK